MSNINFWTVKLGYVLDGVEEIEKYLMRLEVI